MIYDLCLLKNKSKEKGNSYIALVVDLVYKKMYLSCDSSTISEYLNLTVLQLFNLTEKLNFGEILKVGSVNIVIGV